MSGIIRITPAAIMLCVAATATVIRPGLAQEKPSLPFFLPVPEGWRSETIPFPLEFAPDLPYTGLEELRFAPGMFRDDSEEFWSYAFVWWVEANATTDAGSLSTYLEEYFRGLAETVAESREIQVGEATFRVALEAGEDRTFSGQAITFDPFVTRAQVRLNIQGDVRECAEANRRVVFFALSPQAAEHPVWRQLHSIRDGSVAPHSRTSRRTVHRMRVWASQLVRSPNREVDFPLREKLRPQE